MESLLPLLPLLLVILLVWFAARRFSKNAGPETPGPNGETPYGVRGWLAFFVYASMGLAPIISISKVNQTLISAEHKYPGLLSLDGWGAYKGVTWAITLALVTWQIWVAVQLKNKLLPRSVFHAQFLLVAAPMFVVAADATAAKLLLDVADSAEAVGRLISGWVIGSVWLLYFHRSNRVRNTYGIARPTTVFSANARASEAGATTAPTPTSAPTLMSRPGATPPTEVRLKELKQLLDLGLISTVDYEAKKQEILASL